MSEWDQYYLALSQHTFSHKSNNTTKSRVAKDMFKRAFELTRYIYLKLRKGNKSKNKSINLPPVNEVFATDKFEIDVGNTIPPRFFKGFFLPVVKGMDMILNWRNKIEVWVREAPIHRSWFVHAQWFSRFGSALSVS